MTFEDILEKFKALHIEDALNYEVMNEILISHHSTAIEGSTLTEAESRMLILDGLTAKGKPITDHLMMQDQQTKYLQQEIDKVQGEDIFVGAIAKTAEEIS